MAMRSFTADEIAACTGGRVLRSTSTHAAGLALDSRVVKPGSLFAALVGERVDGHDFCAAASEKEASCVLVNRPVEVAECCGVVIVPDVETALRNLGSLVRGEFRGEVVGVVGSCGKTTTKDFAASVLRRIGTVSATEGNRNNLLGVPETLMGADMDHRFWVLEMGISKPGEMADLAPVVCPTGVVFTTIQPVHTEFFPSLRAILDEKARVLEHSEPGAFVALNADDPLLRDLCLPKGMQRILYGITDGADVWAEATGAAGLEGTPFRLHCGGEIAEGILPVSGSHNLSNFAGACAVGWTFGARAASLAESASDMQPASHRGETHRLRDGVLLLDDSYNANPAAVAAVLSGAASWDRRVVAALGEMLELGPSGVAHHEAIGKLAAQSGVSAFLCVGGESAAAMADAFAPCGRPVCHARAWADGAPWFDGQIAPGDGVIVKGSRGIGLDGLVAWLIERRAA